MLVLVLKILIEECVAIQVAGLFFSALHQGVLLHLDLTSELIIRSEVELKVYSYLLILRIYFKTVGDLFQLVFKVEAEVLFHEGSVLQSWPVLHVL